MRRRQRNELSKKYIAKLVKVFKYNNYSYPVVLVRKRIGRIGKGELNVTLEIYLSNLFAYALKNLLIECLAICRFNDTLLVN